MKDLQIEIKARYVRTRDTEYGCLIDTKKYKEMTGEECYIPTHEFLKSSDNIYDLLNRIIVVKRNRALNYKIYRKAEFLKLPIKSLTNDIRGHKITVYGCVWTDKGLIFATKMNTEGDMVVL